MSSSSSSLNRRFRISPLLVSRDLSRALHQRRWRHHHRRRRNRRQNTTSPRPGRRGRANLSSDPPRSRTSSGRSSTFSSRFFARCSVWTTRKSTGRKLETSMPEEDEEGEDEEGITARGDTEGATFTASITTRRRRAREDGKRRDARMNSRRDATSLLVHSSSVCLLCALSCSLL